MHAILLAAGRGSRLGTDKALVELGGTTALDRCIRSLVYGGVPRVRVVLGATADAVAAQVDLSSVEVVVNERPERGQTSSLKLALAGGVDDDGFLLHTVDHPLVEARHVARLLATWKQRAPGQSIVVPSVGGRRGHPALFASALAGEFLALGDDEPAHRVVRASAERILHVEMDDDGPLLDIDTPEDLQRVHALLAERENAG